MRGGFSAALRPPPPPPPPPRPPGAPPAVAGCARVAEGHVLEHDAGAGIRALGRATVGVLHGLLEVLVEVRQVEVVLVHPADGAEHRREGGLPLLEHEQVHRHVAEAEAAHGGGDRDPGVGAVEGARRQEAEEEAPDPTFDRQIAILAVELVEDRLVTVAQQRPEAEELHLLGVVLAREHGLEVGLLAGLGAAPAEEAEGVGGRGRPPAEGGAGGTHQPPRQRRLEPEMQPAVGDEADGVLEQAEGAHHEAEGPRRGLASGAGEAIVEGAVLEVLQRKRERLVEHHEVHAVPELGPQQ